MANLRTKPFFTDVPGALPYTYIIPGTVELILQTLVARFDGSAAAADFLPTLSIYTQDGRLLARVRPDQEFAAGDTGVVTWAPFLRRKVAPTPSSAVVEWCRATASNASLGTGYTAIELTSLSGDFDSNVPTFALSSGDLVLATHGLYSFVIQYGGATINPGVVTVLQLQLDITAGANGTWSATPPGSSGFGLASELVRFDNGTDDYAPYSDPTFSTFIAWDSSDTFPVTLQALAFVEEDEVGVATSTYDFSLFAVRHGSVFGS